MNATYGQATVVIQEPATPAPVQNTATAAPTATAEPVYATAPDGTRLEIGTFTAGQIPGGFTQTDVSYQGKTVTAIRSADGTKTAVYCRSSGANPEGFYILDLTTGKAAYMSVVTVAAGAYALLDASLAAQLPEGCALGSYTLQGTAYTVFIPAASAEYVVLYAVSPEGVAGLYQYDTKEGTVQRYGLSAGGLGLDYTILDPADAGSSLTAPAGCVLTQVNIGGTQYAGYVPEGTDTPAYYIVYARGPSGIGGLYVYDVGEGTFQRYGLTAAEAAAAPSAGPDTGTGSADTALSDAEKKVAELRWERSLLLIGAGAMVAAVVVLAILLLRKSREERERESAFARRAAAMTGSRRPDDRK